MKKAPECGAFLIFVGGGNYSPTTMNLTSDFTSL